MIFYEGSKTYYMDGSYSKIPAENKTIGRGKRETHVGITKDRQGQIQKQKVLFENRKRFVGIVWKDSWLYEQAELVITNHRQRCSYGICMCTELLLYSFLFSLLEKSILPSMIPDACLDLHSFERKQKKQRQGNSRETHSLSLNFT